MVREGLSEEATEKRLNAQKHQPYKEKNIKEGTACTKAGELRKEERKVPPRRGAMCERAGMGGPPGRQPNRHRRTEPLTQILLGSLL